MFPAAVVNDPAAGAEEQPSLLTTNGAYSRCKDEGLFHCVLEDRLEYDVVEELIFSFEKAVACLPCRGEALLQNEVVWKACFKFFFKTEADTMIATVRKLLE